MLRETTPSSKSLFTIDASERSTTLMQNEAMPLPITGLRKGRTAQFTFIRARMLVHRLDMLAELVLLGKTGGAEVASKGAQLEVHGANVFGKVAGLCVSLAADVALGGRGGGGATRGERWGGGGCGDSVENLLHGLAFCMNGGLWAVLHDTGWQRRDGEDGGNVVFGEVLWRGGGGMR